MHIIPEHQQRPIGDEGHRECVGIFAEHELYHQIHILAVWFQGNMVGIGLPLCHSNSLDNLCLGSKHPETACQQKYYSMSYLHTLL